MAFRNRKIPWMAGASAFLLGAAFLVLEEHESPPGGWGREAATRSSLRPGSKLDRPAGKTRKPEKEIRRLADEWYQEFLAKHPEMAVAYRDVPDKENGFLQLLEFADRHDAAGGKGLSLPDDIDKMLNGSAEWNATRFSEWLRANQGMVDEILAIGLLPGQSAKGVDPARYVSLPARAYVDMCEILRGHARLLLEQGDDASALRSLKATLGISNHLEGIETPSLLSETVALLTRGQTWRFVTDTAFTTGNAPADLAAWRDALELGATSPTLLAGLFRGEWHTMTRGILLPQLVSGETDFYRENLEGVDPNEFMEAHLAYYQEMSGKMWNSDLASLMNLDTAATISETTSPQIRALLETLFKGSSGWSKGWVNSQCGAALMDAAFAVAMGEEVPLEPVTGKPFVIDEERGTISMPGDPILDAFKITPVKIPGK